MPHFLYRLVPPRHTFPFDMTDSERQLMAIHGEYWSALTEKGSCAIFGLVLDPQEPWGLAIVEAEDEDAAQALFNADPAVKSGTCTYRFAPMHVAGIRQAVR